MREQIITRRDDESLLKSFFCHDEVLPGELGLCALDFTRSDAKIRGAMSLHSLLKPALFSEPKGRAKVLMLHGYGIRCSQTN